MITLDQAIDAGSTFLLDHAAFDMYKLATSMAVSRATLYRVTTSQDRLLAEVLWRMAERALERARAQRSQDGIEGVLEVVRHFSRQVLATRSLRRFVDNEPETLTRVLSDGVVHRRAIRAVTALFDECGIARGGMLKRAVRRATGLDGLGLDGFETTGGLVEDPERVGYLLVRLVESLCFAEVAGTRPDVELTVQTVRGLLVRASTPRQSRGPRLSRVYETAMCLMWTAMPEFLLAGDNRFPLVFS